VAIQQQQDGEAGKPSVPEQDSPALTGTGTARRRFARAGMGVSGVILTLTSQPGMACTVCKSPSGSLSGGLKSHKGPPVVCAGKPPSYWCGSGSWPSNCLKSTTLGQIFTCRTAQYRDCTFENILKGANFDSKEVGKYCAAAYLNTQAGLSTFLPPATVKAMLAEWLATGGGNIGYYRLNAKTKWYYYDIVRYLKGTMD
jgi:hypothetical protein